MGDKSALGGDKTRLFAVLALAAGIIATSFYVISGSDKFGLKEDNEAGEEESAGDAGLDAFVTARRDKGEAGAESVRPVGDGDLSWGADAAALEIIIYDDYCGAFSPDFARAVDKLAEDWGSRVRFAQRYYAYDQSDFSLLAAAAAICAGREGKYLDMRRALYEANEAGEAGESAILARAAAIGLGEDFRLCLMSSPARDEAAGQAREAEKYGVSGTPAFFLGGRFYPGAYPYEDFIRSDGEEVRGLRSLVTAALAAGGGEGGEDADGEGMGNGMETDSEPEESVSDDPEASGNSEVAEEKE